MALMETRFHQRSANETLGVDFTTPQASPESRRRLMRLAVIKTPLATG